ncbi:MAG TPA: pyridoxamine 5'-phosphate oxidase family protein [Hungateiclostridium thermocellum]|jgi:nitroimidazol reductase NimA-like FMN-containing flavoprotein (pyridoxamine 5'-phosphate oxidase superfamily)|uniref:5-nitroimidazole antibiotic resistance protein n=2 Tax=Acetivibrio thermocellus TaxID=1515 RepID=A3DBY1_ACET2|nr:pyridoxamine 5'-phosphate oxidase family protein [Acetivibrio thermocellus]CDG34900.1 5-nitroimidazole antibiotic resistance protein [Acetivibrio thermocellus BC1]HPU42575.1 pyridoxamine 5'-phosphate oxidase family protein [Acetivibrio clariflavus]ABN51460.1 5-nitroimidazole antibiotic resistance protein [Acetivibrio thermocellus ATCC 27405]ADU75056.1 5-nitroimidazole antibiotic resistance protein [Acetivibrio thermocellus DSM 1313]ALX09031.1 Pyridoxamine 5'-phosphate oxidase-related protei
MKLRRKDREVTEIKELIQIIDQCKVCRIAIQDSAGLYIVPMNFGYAYENNQLVLFFHSAKDGRKVRALKENSDVCFEMDCEHRLITGDTACQYSYSFKSIIGNGKVVFIDDAEEKKAALSALMKHQTGKDFSFDDKMIDSVLVFKIIVHEFTGKYHP